MIKSYKKYIDIMKILTAKGRILSGFDTNGTDSNQIKDEEIIKYIYRIFCEKNSPYYLLHKSRNKILSDVSSSFLNNHNLGKFSHKKYIYMNEMKNNIKNSFRRNKSKNEKRRESIFLKLKKTYCDNNNNNNTEQKNFHQFIYEEMSPDKQKIDFFSKKINLTNELKYQIEITHNEEGKERFKALLDQIESLKNENVKDYINFIKDNYNNFKGEIIELIKAREKEERINNFLLDLIDDRELISKRKMFLEKRLHLEDKKFESSMGEEYL